MMPVVTFDHIQLRSPDPEATAAWFEQMLSGEIIRRPGRVDVRTRGHKCVHCNRYRGDGVGVPPVTPHQGLDHFGLTVENIEAVATELRRKGVVFTTELMTIRPGVRGCFIRGPQDISIELLERESLQE